MAEDKKYAFFTRMVRICKNNPDNIQFLRGAIKRDSLEQIAPIVINVARDSGDPIGKVLAECLADDESFNHWIDIYELLPENTVALREVRLIVVEKMLETVRQFILDDWEIVAEITGAYASALSDMGMREKALKLAGESACLYLRNSMDNTLNYMQSFQVYAESLMALGKMTDAILVQKMVVDVCQRIDGLKEYENVYHSANSLLVLSSYYKVVEQFKQAILYGEKALIIVKPYSDASDEYAYLYHQIIRSLADCYEHTDKLERARDLITDNLKIIRDLADSSADSYTLELIDTLEIIATIESRFENREKAISYANEAITLFEERYHQRQKALAAYFVSLLNNMSLIDMSFNDLGEAFNKLNKAEEILKPLFKLYPERFAATYAAHITNCIEIYLALHMHDKALHDAHKTLCLYRKIRSTDMAEYKLEHDANIAMALNTLANVRMIDQDAFRAFRSINTSIKYYRYLVEQDPSYLNDLATTLGTLAVIQERAENYSLALETADEAILYWELCGGQLQQLHPKSFFLSAMTRLSCLVELEEYDQAQRWSENLILFSAFNALIDDGKIGELIAIKANLFSQMGKVSEATENGKAACDIYRSMPIDQVPSDKLDLAEALTNLCFMQAAVNPEEAFETIQEAVVLYEEIPEPFTIDMTVNLAMALLNQGSLAHECGKEGLAIESLRDALFYQNQIVEILEDNPGTESYKEDLLTILQTLLNVEYKVQNSGFNETLKSLRNFLSGYVQNKNDLDIILQKLDEMAQSFTENN